MMSSSCRFDITADPDAGMCSRIGAYMHVAYVCKAYACVCV